MKGSKSPKILVFVTALLSGALSFCIGLFWFKDQEALVWNDVFLFCLCITVVFAAAFWLAIRKYITQRVQQLFKALPAMSSGIEKTPSEIVKMDRDIIDQVGAEMEKWAVRQKREMVKLQKTADFRREFVGNLAHELKTPIFNIQGYVLTLLEGALEDPEINRKFLLRAGKSVDRMIQLISELDDITRLESGAAMLDIRKFDLLSLVKEILDMEEHAAEDKNISLKVKTFSNTPIWVKGDSGKIGQVLTNLIANSIYYGVEGGKTEVSFVDKSDEVIVEVADTGIGISAEDAPRVFERFYRVDKSRNRNTGGSGLGLAISKHIVEAHGKSIQVKSEKGKGSTFSFAVPK